jgi:hypothetical protein
MNLTPTIHYKGNLDDFETEMKGYRNDVLVKAPNGDMYEVFFYDPVRLANDLGNGSYLAHPGLIILKTVNKASIEMAIAELWAKGFFAYFKPLGPAMQKHFDENI